MKMSSDLRNKIAADIFVNTINNMTSVPYIYDEIEKQTDKEGKEIGVYIAEQSIGYADGFIKVLNEKEKENKRING